MMTDTLITDWAKKFSFLRTLITDWARRAAFMRTLKSDHRSPIVGKTRISRVTRAHAHSEVMRNFRKSVIGDHPVNPC